VPVKAERERDYVEYVTGRIPTLRRLATQLVGDAHRADDLVQQTITRLYTRWSMAVQAHNLDAYVHRILIRAFLDERRLKWAAVRLGHAPCDRAATAPGSPATTDVENRLVLYAALAKLPPRQRAVVVLRYLADHSVDETAEILRVSPGTVKSHTFNGLAALRRLLAERHIDPNLGVTS
jgi:RNA polymerase sigma-70 factor (sigma-E family)